ncbi:Putrescine transport system permease protein PotH [Cupriavidus laharis]|uniref:Putrescine transport system permease protein PotH n=1 Tax=Cupriavidus laharis TaxID=151654 RepID=A0ABN7YDU9_9BURK|nr:ABC transporter permease subunit [Cupriavidus laharis]CAG9171093.1 Putrescine transport system permease protein PotH [Cupriavidus laharis]
MAAAPRNISDPPRPAPAWQRFALLVTLAWLVIFFLLPFLSVIKLSLSAMRFGMPPYTEPLALHHGTFHLALHLDSYRRLLSDSLYLEAFFSSLKIAATTTLCCLLLGYPVAYCIARVSPRWRHYLVMAVMLPFLTSFLIRVYAWIGILKNEGLLNQLLLAAGIIHHPLALYHTTAGVYVGMVYSYLPFMLLPLYAHLARMDTTLLEAAQDLGARPWRAFLQVTLPLSRNGIVAGCLLVFIPSVGEYVIPSLLGGADTLMIGRLMWDEFFNNTDWPMASALACAMLALLLGPMALFQRLQARGGGARR